MLDITAIMKREMLKEAGIRELGGGLFVAARTVTGQPTGTFVGIATPAARHHPQSTLLGYGHQPPLLVLLADDRLSRPLNHPNSTWIL